MALVTKTIRCAVCGSSDVAFDGKTYHCASCGTDSEVGMPAADLAAVNPPAPAVQESGHCQLGQRESSADQVKRPSLIFSMGASPSHRARYGHRTRYSFCGDTRKPSGSVSRTVFLCCHMATASWPMSEPARQRAQ